MSAAVRHPCQWTPAVLDHVAGTLNTEAGNTRLCVLDPFAGTGLRVAAHPTSRRHVWVGIELEQSFICAPWVEHGNARHLPFGAAAFNAAATSFVFPNRMVDSFISSENDQSRRHTYSHAARANREDRTYKLHSDNAGAMGWGTGDGQAWRDLHTAVIAELIRVLTPRGLAVIEISNHLVTRRKGQAPTEVDAVGWVREEMRRAGCSHVSDTAIPVRRLRHGTNGDSRVPCTQVTAWRAP